MSHPLLNAFWMMLWFFLWIMWLMLLFRVFGDIFRDKDLSGWGKTGWIILVCVLPFLGVFIYLIARGHGMATRSMERAMENQQQFDDYVRKAAGTPGSRADELARLAELRSNGTLSEQEFQQAKEKVLA